MEPPVPTWMCVHRSGLTAMVMEMWGYVHVSYTTDSDNALSIQGDDASVDLAQARADAGSRCPQPCTCQPWSQIGLAPQPGAFNDPKRPLSLSLISDLNPGKGTWHMKNPHASATIDPVAGTEDEMDDEVMEYFRAQRPVVRAEASDKPMTESNRAGIADQGKPKA